MKWWYFLLGLVPVPVGFRVDEWTDTVIHATVVLCPVSIVLLDVVSRSQAALARLIKNKDGEPTEMEGYDTGRVHGENSPGVCKQD
jgi:hypothetical protein